MKTSLFALVFLLSHPTLALAQRDAPVWNSYLPRIAMFDERKTLDFEITFQKDGGPHEQFGNSQVYVLGYLEKDERRILELAADKKLTSKASKEEKLLLDVLVAEKLVAILETKVAAKSETPLVISPKSGRSIHALCFDYAFSFDNKELFKTIGGLKNFDANNISHPDDPYYEDKMKLMIFVPVNDSRYATKIPKEQRDFHDFAHFMDSETIIQYFKPLPYRFQFRPLKGGDEILLYID